MNTIDFASVFIQKSVGPSEASLPVQGKESKQSDKALPFKQVIAQQMTNDKTSPDGTAKNEIVKDPVFTKNEEIPNAADEIECYSLKELESLLRVDEAAGQASMDENPLFNVEADGGLSEERIAFGQMNVEATDESQSIDETLLAELYAIIDAIQQMLQQPVQTQNADQLTKDIARLLKMWETLPQERRFYLTENKFLLPANVKNEAAAVLNELLGAYENRLSLLKRQVYAFEASVTQNDLKNWLTQALQRHKGLFEHMDRPNVNSQQPLPMSKTEQYIFHATKLERIDAVSRNLVHDVQQVVKRSNFLKQPGLEQLTFTLRPASLGEVTIRLVQTDGTMTVKFIVTTQAAKELFEANIHQLKHMFAPNQIAIERDMNVSDKQFFQEEQETLEQQDEREERQERQNNKKQDENSDVSFEELLHLLSKEAIVDA